MGFFDNIFRALGISKPPAAKIVCVGLDNSGKTTLLNTLKSEKAKTNADEIVPTGKWFLKFLSKLEISAKITIIVVFSRNMPSLTKFRIIFALLVLMF